jgi:hypothetical protein
MGFAKWPPIRHIPKEDRIATVRSDVIDFVGQPRDSFILTISTQSILGKR